MTASYPWLRFFNPCPPPTQPNRRRSRSTHGSGSLILVIYSGTLIQGLRSTSVMNRNLDITHWAGWKVSMRTKGLVTVGHVQLSSWRFTQMVVGRRRWEIDDSLVDRFREQYAMDCYEEFVGNVTVANQVWTKQEYVFLSCVWFSKFLADLFTVFTQFRYCLLYNYGLQTYVLRLSMVGYFLKGKHCPLRTVNLKCCENCLVIFIHFKGYLPNQNFFNSNKFI